MTKKIAVVLCGSGFQDGSEIRESVALLLSLSEANIAFQCFAPNENQFDVMNCLTNTPMAEKRNMLVEAARIARSDVKDLKEYNPNDFSGLAFPGGFGVAKNLCTFANDGKNGKILLGVERAILETYEQKKPILAICIAPALLALALKNKAKITITLGEDNEAAQEIEKLGHIHSEQKVTAFTVDIHNKIISTPAYMYGDANLADIFTGIRNATQAFINLC